MNELSSTKLHAYSAVKHAMGKEHPKAVKVIQGGSDIGQPLLEHKWANIFFTGSARVGSIVMTAAAKHLTPVALELGGKCPAIIDSLSSDRDKMVTVDRLVAGKWGVCSGQACIAVNYVLVEDKFAPALIELIKETLKKFNTKPENSARIVNKLHFQRLRNLVEDPSVASCIVHGGSMDFNNLTIEPTILVDPPLDAKIVTEEIFGPLLPIITEHTIEISHCSSFSNRLYNFTGKGDEDPSLDSLYAANLKNKCKFANDTTSTVEMDPGSLRTFDIDYYKNVLKRRGLFQSDSALTKNSVTKSLVETLVSSSEDKLN